MTVDIHALSGAYAVEAVDAFERAQFERHLDECPSCRAEVDSLRAAATLLPEVAAQPAPDRLRTSVLAGIQTVRPLPPVLAAAAEKASRRRRLVGLVAAAAALVALGGLGGAVVVHQTRDEAPVSASASVSSVLRAPDREVFADTGADGARIEVVRSVDLGRAVITADGLPVLPEGRVYQLWFDQGGVMEPAGFLDDPSVTTPLHGDATTATSANITVEDAEGAEHPDLDNVVGAVALEA